MAGTSAPTPNPNPNTAPNSNSDSNSDSNSNISLNPDQYSKNNDWWSEDTLVRFQNMNLEGGEPWRDVEANITKMDLLYDATFRSWLKDEENVVVVSSYLHRIANEYPLDRIVNALKWLVSSWSIESVSIIIKHVTADWNNFKQNADFKTLNSSNFQLKKHQKMIDGETKRGFLIREITRDWPCIQIAKLISNLSTIFWSNRVYQEYFLKALVLDWDFCHLSEFFSYIGTQLGLDYRLKVSMLQQSAKRNLKISINNIPQSALKNVQKRLIHDVETDTTKRPRINSDLPCLDLDISINRSRDLDMELDHELEHSSSVSSSPNPNSNSAPVQNAHYVPSDQPQDSTPNLNLSSPIDQQPPNTSSNTGTPPSLPLPLPLSLPLSQPQSQLQLQQIDSSIACNCQQQQQQQHPQVQPQVHHHHQRSINHEVSSLRPSTSSNTLSLS